MSIAKKLMTTGVLSAPASPTSLNTLVISCKINNGDTMGLVSYDVSDVKNGNIFTLAQSNPADFSDREIGKLTAINGSSSGLKQLIVSIRSESIVYSLDLTNPADSSGWVRDSIDIDSSGEEYEFTAVDHEGHYIFLGSDSTTDIYSLDVSNIDSLPTPADFASPQRSETRLSYDNSRKVLFWGANPDLQEVDATDPENLSAILTFDTESNLTEISYDEDRSLVHIISGSWEEWGIVDTSDLLAPTVLAMYDTGGDPLGYPAYDSINQILLITSGEEASSTQNALYIIDVSDPMNATTVIFDLDEEALDIEIDQENMLAYCKLETKIAVVDYSGTGTLVAETAGVFSIHGLALLRT